MITERHIEVFRLVELHGCTQGQAGEMIDPPVTRQRVGQMLAEIYEDRPNLKPMRNGKLYTKRGTVTYDSSMDGLVVKKF